MSVKNFLSEMNNDKTEGYILKSLLVSLVSGFFILLLFYFIFFRDGDFGRVLFFSILAIISYSILMPSLLQVKSYEKLSCMPGMMVGMTFGMIAGFLPGFYVASVSGMFYGSLFGMLVGIYFGYRNGNCCGIMGIMEGVMAGFMGGLMGAMTSVMLLNDNLFAMAIIVLIISLVIMFSLSYMLYKEGKTLKNKKEISYSLIIISSIILSVLTLLFMAFGPKGGIFS